MSKHCHGCSQKVVDNHVIGTTKNAQYPRKKASQDKQGFTGELFILICRKLVPVESESVMLMRKQAAFDTKGGGEETDQVAR